MAPQTSFTRGLSGGLLITVVTHPKYSICMRWHAAQPAKPWRFCDPYYNQARAVCHAIVHGSRPDHGHNFQYAGKFFPTGRVVATSSRTTSRNLRTQGLAFHRWTARRVLVAQVQALCKRRAKPHRRFGPERGMCELFARAGSCRCGQGVELYARLSIAMSSVSPEVPPF